jgi:hypothetical protein
MATTLVPPCDPAALAESVRVLAHRAHRALSGRASQPSEIRSLLQQTRRLRDQTRDWPSRDLPHWLEHVERRLENG